MGESAQSSIEQISELNSVFNPAVFSQRNEQLALKERPVPILWSTVDVYLRDDFNLSHLFKLPYDYITQLMYALSKDVHISWSDFNEMPFYEILMITDAHMEFIERQNSDSDKQNDMISQQQAQMESMYRKQQNSMPKYDAPKMPQMPQFQMPHI